MTQSATPAITRLPSVFDWLLNHPDPRPWLICGTGPSFDRYAQIDLARYRLCALNETVRHLPLSHNDLAHVTDVENFERSAGYYNMLAAMVVCPWVPHEQKKPGRRTLDQWCDQLALFEALQRRGQLLFYNSTKTDARAGVWPAVEVHYGSGEAAIGMLAMGGVKTIRTIGIDGSAEHSALFAKTTRSRDPLNYRAETLAIKRIIKKYHVDYAPA